MMPAGSAPVWIAIVAGAVCVALVGARTRRRALYVAGKAVASLGFLATALASGATSSAWGPVALVALALATVGDVLLALPGSRTLLAGLAAFAVAHLVFSAAFVARGVGSMQQTTFAGAVAAAAVGMVLIALSLGA
jgi:uncharacterized membrane protein YhhN